MVKIFPFQGYRFDFDNKEIAKSVSLPYDIISDEEGHILIIDWLQSVPSNHPNASQILMRDLRNICNYFKKKYKIQCDINKILRSFIEK